MRAGDDKASALVACPQCRHKFRLPEAEAEAADEPPVAATVPRRAPPPVSEREFDAADDSDDSDGADDSDRSESLPRLPTFDVEPHKAVGNAPPLGAILVLVLVFVAGVGIGWLASFIGQWFYLIMLFPIAIGFVVVMAGWAGMYVGKVTSPWFGAVAGLLGGIVAMSSLHYFDYVHSGAKGAGLTIGEYFDRQATAGVQLFGRPGRGGGINLGYVGSFIYWGAEVLVVLFIGCVLGVIIAASPFCADCNRWKDKKELGTCLVAMEGDRAATIELLQKDFAGGRLSRLAGEDDDAILKIAMSAYVCPNCAEGSVDAQLHWFDVDSEGKPARQDLPLISYPPEAIQVFETLFRPERKQDRASKDEDDEPRPRKKKRHRDD